MRHLTLPLLYTVLSTLFFCCCTNDENIGDFYGRWQITAIQTPDTLIEPDNLFLSFQSYTVFASVNDYALHQANDYVGNWSQPSHSTLRLQFVPTDENMTYRYETVIRDFFHMGDYRDVNLAIESMDAREMHLSNGTTHWYLHIY